MPAEHTQRRLASIREAAEHHGVHHNTIRRRIADGTLTAYRFGPRIVRVDLDELAEAFHPAHDRDARGEEVAQHVARVIADAPPLTDEQRERIASLLRAGGASA